MRLKPRWNKIFFDLWINKTRALLVILSIAVGVFAVGMISHAYLMLDKGATENYLLTNPFSAVLITTPFDDDLVTTIRKMPEVKDADGQHTQTMRINVNGNWYSLHLSALNFDDPHVNLLEMTRGSYPPQDRQLVIDQTAYALTDIGAAAEAVVETPGGEHFRMPIVGLVRDMNTNPSINSNGINAYTTFETLEWLGYSQDYNRLYFVAAEKQTELNHIQQVTGLVRDKIEGSGTQVFLSIIMPEPGENPINFVLDSIRVVLGTLAVVSLFLSAFLVYNTITALVKGQTVQIGIMKSIGGNRSQLVSMYLLLVSIFGVLAFIIAMPPAAWAAFRFAEFIASPKQTDTKLPEFYLPFLVLALEIFVSLLVPILAALPSVLAGSRIPVHEATTSRGLQEGNFGNNFIDRLFNRLHFFTGPWLLAFSNTLRQKKRVALTLGTLVLGGAVFIGVSSVRDSSNLTVREMGEAYRFDIEVVFEQPYRLARVRQEALQVPGVIEVEGWGGISGTIIHGDGSEGNNIYILAPPAGSEMTQPKIVKGRWLVPGDETGIVVGTDYLRENPGLKIGDDIDLKIKGRQYSWQVVGVYRVIGINALYRAYANYSYIASLANEVDQTSRLQLVTAQHDEAFQKSVTAMVDEHFRDRGLHISTLETSSSLRGVLINQFDTIVKVLLMMALLLMLVGGLGLAGTMSMNILERTREIGVMRAVGASDRTIYQIVMAEGFLIATVSWLISLGLAFPVGRTLSWHLGRFIMNGPLSYTYSFSGALTWLILVEFIAILASFWPARIASQLTVRDVLAYE